MSLLLHFRRLQHHVSFPPDQVYAVRMLPLRHMGAISPRERACSSCTHQKNRPATYSPSRHSSVKGAASMRFSCPAWINGTAIHAERVILMMKPNVTLIPARKYHHAEWRHR